MPHRAAASIVFSLFLVLMLALLVFPCLAANASEPTQPAKPGKRKIAILAFEAINEGAKQDNKGRMVSEIFTTSAVNSGIFEVVERHLIEKVLEEMEFGKGQISGTVAQKIGVMVGADSVLTGTVSQFLDDLRIDARLINVSDGKILLASAETAKLSMGSIVEAADKGMRKIVVLLDPEAAKRIKKQAGPITPSVQPKTQPRQEHVSPAAPTSSTPLSNSGLGTVVITSNNTQFMKYSSGVFVDTTTNLEWYASPNQVYTFDKAKSWVASLNVAGGGWRMPTRNELATTKADKFQMVEKTVKCMQKNSEGACLKFDFTGETGTYDCYRPGVIDWQMLCCFVWSGEMRDFSSGWVIDFSTGEEGWAGLGDFGPSGRAFAVRSRR